MTGSAPRVGDRAHAVALFAAGALTCLYWVLYFLTDLTHPDFAGWPAAAGEAALPAVYDGFESAFPAADAFTALTLALAAFYLWAGDRLAAPFALVGSGAMAFLALIDVQFNLLHGFYAPGRLAVDPGLDLELLINLGCLALSLFTLARMWPRAAP